MNSKGFPCVSSYQSYFSYEAIINLFDPIIFDKGITRQTRYLNYVNISNSPHNICRILINLFNN